MPFCAVTFSTITFTPTFSNMLLVEPDETETPLIFTEDVGSTTYDVIKVELIALRTLIE